MSTDKPILFSAPMVRAILDGRKTQTRRVIKPQPTKTGTADIGGSTVDLAEWEIRTRLWRSIKFKEGQRLWVREAFALVGSSDPGFPLYRASGYEAECLRHGFDKPYPPEQEVKWKPSIFMPRTLSRILLEIVEVRIERLNQISSEDAIAEGLMRMPFASALAQGTGCAWGFEGDRRHGSAISAFAALWNHVNGEGAWSLNPWVAAYTFRRVQ